MVAEWIAVAVIVVIGIFFLQMEHHMRKYKIIIIAIIGLVIYFSILGVFSSEDIDFKSPKSIVSGIYLYVGWLGQAASNLWDIGGDTVTMVGNVIKVNNTEQERPRR